MVFESNEHTYEVIQLLRKQEPYDTYLCMCDDRKYILICVRDEAVLRSCCRLFLEAAEQNQFDGLQECFSHKSEMVFVLSFNTLHLTLEQMMEYDLSFEKRLHILKKLLAGLCVHEIPVFVACDLFLHGNMGIGGDDTGDGYFNLMELEKYETFDMGYFQQVLSDCIRKVFPREVKKNHYKELAEFCRRLQAAQYGSFLEIYETYSEINQQIQNQLKQKGKHAGKSKEKSLEKARKIIGIIKNIFIILIIILALGVLLWSFKGSKKNGGGIYSYIGDITIEEYTQAGSD